MEASYKRRNCQVIEQGKKMAFNNRYSDERFHVNPRDLLFTQPDIKSTFTDPTHPSVRETASLIRRGELKPHEFGDLHVSIDEQGHLWCDNNIRLFAYREAGVDSVPVVFDGNRRPKTSLKVELSDPDFVPRIRGEASRVQIPLSPTSGREGYEMHKGSSLPGFVSGGYLGLDEEDEDEYGARFAQLGIRASCTESLGGASRVQKPPTPTPEQTPEQNAYQIGKRPLSRALFLVVICPTKKATIVCKRRHAGTTKERKSFVFPFSHVRMRNMTKAKNTKNALKMKKTKNALKMKKILKLSKTKKMKKPMKSKKRKMGKTKTKAIRRTAFLLFHLKTKMTRFTVFPLSRSRLVQTKF